METGLEAVTFRDVKDRQDLTIPGDYSRAVTLVVSLMWKGAVSGEVEPRVTLRLFDGLGAGEFWSIPTETGEHKIYGGGRSGSLRARIVVPFGPELSASVSVAGGDIFGRSGRLDEAVLKVFWRGF